MFKTKTTGLYLVLFFISLHAIAQEIKPKGQFLEDSLKIGLPVQYTVSIKYPKTIDIVFPDSLYDYSPFEFDHKRYFSTRSDSIYSYDSAVYYITSFEIDSVQYFKLPVFIIKPYDSTAVYTAEDSIFLKHLVAEIPDSVALEAIPLIENTTYRWVDLQFNYPNALLGLVIFIVIAAIVIIFFGKKIRRAFKLRQLKQAYTKFLTHYDQLATEETVPDKNQSEKVLLHWKKYLEKLESVPYTKMTTKEILNKDHSDELSEPLKELDRVLYAHKIDGADIPKHFMSLKKYAHQHYTAKLEEVKNG